jgi:PAS domain S-box-containing protein
MKILVADDDLTSRRMLSVMLAKWGFEVVCCGDGNEVWLALQTDDAPRLLVLDWMMPGMDGVEICRRLRKIDTPVPPYIILLTFKRYKEDVVSGLEAGANDYIIKPFDFGELLARIEVGKRVMELQSALADRVEKLQRQERELKKVHRALRVLSESNHALVRATSESEFLKKICRIIVKTGGYCLAWVGYAEGMENRLRPVAQAGDTKDLHMIPVAGNEDPESGPLSTATRKGNVYIVRDIEQDPNYAPWRDEAGRRGYASAIALPLMSAGVSFGALRIYAAETGAFDAEEAKLLQELANDLAFGITSLRTAVERRKAEEELHSSKDTLHVIFNNVYDAIFIHEPDGTIVDVNDKMLKMYGVERAQAPILSIINDYSGKDNPSDYLPLLWKKAAAGENQFFEWIARRPGDGSTFDVEMFLSKLVIGTRELILANVRDISERKRVENSLQKAVEEIAGERAKSDAIIAAVGDGINILDKDYKILYQNRVIRELMGDHMGKFCYRAYDSNEDVCEGCPMVRSFYDGKLHRAERVMIVQDSARTLEITTSPIRDVAGNIVAGLEIIRDITEQRTIEAQLHQAQKMEAIGQFAGGIAHDFNNILTAIIGYGHLLLMKLTEGDQPRNFVEQILFSAERAAGLTQSLLTFSRKRTIHPQPVESNSIILKVEKLLKRLIGENIELVVELASEALTVMADSGQIEQVIMNLATNARDAMPGGGLLTIKTELFEMDRKYVRAHGYGKPGRYARITVTDTGTGMDKKTKEKIFEPFFTTKEVGKGTGLGLAIIYGIIKQHNGFVNVYSEKGVGTTFNIYLPLISVEVKKTEEQEFAVPTGGAETLLLAEDDGDVRRLTKELLVGYGYTVIEALDGDDALQKFIEHRESVQLLMLDVIMPKRNGRDVYNKVKKMEPGIKVLFTSGYPAEIIRSKRILDEGLEFITKPIVPRDLLERVRSVLDSR